MGSIQREPEVDMELIIVPNFLYILNGHNDAFALDESDRGQT